MATVMTSHMGDPTLASFAPAEGSHPMQTPFGSLQLANALVQQQQQAQQQQQQQQAMKYSGSDDEEEDDDDDDDEDGTSKGKRKRSKTSAGKGSKKTTKGAPGMGAAAAGERDSHTGRRKIRIEFIEDDSRRHITFSKRKAGIMKKVSNDDCSQTGK
jgi:pheromone receptor transcription factor